MATLDELSKVVESLKIQVQSLESENRALKDKLGIRQYLQPKKVVPADAEMSENQNSEPSPPNQRERKPPPFYIRGVKSTTVLNTMVNKQGVKISEMKALANGELKIQPQQTEDYRNLRKLLDKPALESENDKKALGVLRYHTYQLREDKPFTVYVRNLHHSTEHEEIANELATLGYQVINITNIQIKKRYENRSTLVKLPLFKVDLQPNENNRSILSLTTLLQFRISVELPKKSSTIAQCRRCQEIGHTQNFCTKAPKCVKCGDRHPTKECKKPKDAPPKCANCGGEHTANYRGCSVFQSKSRSTKISAVERINQKTPASSNVGNSSRMYAAVVTTSSVQRKEIAPQRPVYSQHLQSSLPSLAPQQPSEESEILKLLKNIQSKQEKMDDAFTRLEAKVNQLESNVSVLGSSPSPRARKTRKT